MRSSERLFDLLMAHRVIAGALLLLVTVFLAAGLTRFRFDNSYTIWFVEDDPALQAYDAFLETFGSDEVLVVAVGTEGDALSPETLQIVRDLSEALLEQEQVTRVWSLTHMEMLRNTGLGLESKRLISEVPGEPEELAEARALLDASPIYSRLVDPSGEVTAVLAVLELTEDSFTPKAELIADAREIVGDVVSGRPAWLAGAAVIDEAFYRYSDRDLRLFAPIMAAVLILALLALFRSLAAVLLPLGVVGISVLWAAGFMFWMGWVANVVTTVLPTLLVAVGIADSIHLLQQFRLHARRGEDRETALREAFVGVLRPCLLTTLTTAAGMASLSVASLSGIREMGLTAAFGVVAAFMLTMVGMPVAISLLPDRAMGGLMRPSDRPVPTFLTATARFGIRFKAPVAAAALGLVVFAGFGMARLDVGASMISYFYEDDPVYLDGLAVDRAFGGSIPAEVLVQAKSVDSLLEPEALAAIDRVAAVLEAEDAAGYPISATDFLREARRVLRREPPDSLHLPETRKQAAEILLLTEGDAEVSRFLTPDYQRARVQIPIETGRYEQIVERLPEIEEALDEAAGDVVTAEVTGLARLMGGMEKYLVSSQINTFTLAFALVMLCIAVMFRSARAGLLSAVPNLFPLAIVLGGMGWVGIPLDLTTVMIAPMLLGLVVDDTVHVMERVIERRADGDSVEAAFERSVGDVGHAVVITSIILAAGFGCLLLGSFRPNFNFAVLSVTAIGLALLGDLVVFPAVGSIFPGLVPGARRDA